MTDAQAAPQDYTWWTTELVTSSPENIWFRGKPIADIIGTWGVGGLLWFLVMGTEPEPARTTILDAVLVAGATFGPRAPSIGVARMAATCGVPMNGVMASAVGTLGDIHGGAIEQSGELIDRVARADDIDVAAAQVVADAREHRAHLPGFGHRFLRRDPRAARLFELVTIHGSEFAAPGRFRRAAGAIQEELSRAVGKPMPMNIDGGSAMALLEIGFPRTAFRGVFCLSRSIGILAEAHEELLQGGRLKGPSHPSDGSVKYVGPPPQ